MTRDSLRLVNFVYGLKSVYDTSSALYSLFNYAATDLMGRNPDILKYKFYTVFLSSSDILLPTYQTFVQYTFSLL